MTDSSLTQTKWTLRRHHVNSGGYDSSNFYWGVDKPLWRGESPDGTSKFVRSHTRKGAIDEIRKEYPGAEFYR